MKLEMTELGPVKRSLKIEVPEEAVKSEFQKVYAQLRRQAKIPGFRPGKAPIALLEKRYADLVEQDVVQRLVPDYYQRAVKEAGVVPILVDIPPLERMKVKSNSPFTFTATVEIKPTIQLGDYRPPNPISLKRDARTVTDDQVEKALQSLREQHAELDVVPEGTPLREGLHAVLSIEGFVEDQPLEGTQKKGHLLHIGSKSPILGVELDEYLIGKQAGDTIDIPQTFPANHPDAHLAGKTMVLKVTIDAVKEQKLPELDDEFAKDCGDYDSLEHLKTTINTQLDNFLKQDLEEGYKDQVIERLLQMHHFEIPEVLIERELQTLIRQKMLKDHRHAHREDDVEEPLRLQEEAKRLQQELHPEAKRRVKLSLILDAIVQKEGLHVTEDEVNAEIQKLASSLKLPVGEIQRMVEAGGQGAQEEFRERMKAEKALQFVYQNAVIQG
ncbi:trigger factor [Candidatus Nitrospira allomarina]|uniref:Trigger factor n=1 Tax=Candidatus Nitrospira allomarina TaxID=3020900 RepID=A0AA96GFF7_9BACT|nr:trigger factor [Candidatus Nitrospira allomarina]WNM59105.1 trigger factor [Candidatus Nitrospira allomarina]